MQAIQISTIDTIEIVQARFVIVLCVANFAQNFSRSIFEIF